MRTRIHCHLVIMGMTKINGALIPAMHDWRVELSVSASLREVVAEAIRMARKKKILKYSLVQYQVIATRP